MLKNAFILFMLAIGFPLFSQDITGSWGGTLNIQNTKLRVVFNIEKTDTVYTAKMDSPDQGAFGLPTTKTTFDGDKLEITASGLGLHYAGTLQDDSIAGTFNQGGISLPLTLKRVEKPVLNRPQTPQEPFPYVSEEVIFPNKKDSVQLSGTLTLPDSAGTFPAVILVHGSGPNDRDETVFGHKPFLVIADYLTRNGFAVLRYDKRGVGQSTGDFRRATVQNFADDAKAALAYLHTRKDIDKSRIGLLGHSEGGMAAAMTAAKNRNIRFITLLATPGEKGVEIILDQNRLSLQAMELDSLNMERQLNLLRETLESLTKWEDAASGRAILHDHLSQLWEQLPILIKLKVKKEPYIRSQFNAMVLPGYRSFLKTNPALFLQQVSCSVLAINGEKDTQVLADKNLQAIEKALKKGKNNRVEIKKYAQLNHLFQECVTGQVNEYEKIEQTISPEVLSDITNWMKAQIQ